MVRCQIYGSHTMVVCRSPKSIIVVRIHRPVPYSPVVQMVNTPDCLSGDHGFESRRGCHMVPSSNRPGRQPLKLVMLGSNPAGITNYTRVAELEDASGSSPDAQQGLRVRFPPRVPSRAGVLVSTVGFDPAEEGSIPSPGAICRTTPDGSGTGPENRGQPQGCGGRHLRPAPLYGVIL